ncbi:MAG TPA: cation diffusion facilitator family transporter [Acidobacteriaceae bacterium]
MHVHAAPTAKTQQVLRFSVLATLVYVAVTFVAGLRAHSLALISEAGHNISDAGALLLSFVAVYFQARPATDEKTFGYQRAGVLAAFFNAITLVGISIWIAIAAIARLGHPAAVATRPMMLVAAAGVVMNGVIALLLWKQSRDVNMRSVFIHMLGDTLSTAAVIAGGAAIYFTGYTWIDPVLSLLIAILILWTSISIVHETLNILLEGTPQGISLPASRTLLSAIDGVLDVHDLHVWSLGSQTHALATHICIADIPPSESKAILAKVKHSLAHSFHIHHTTIQFEHAGCETTHGCVMTVGELSAPAHHHHGHSH